MSLAKKQQIVGVCKLGLLKIIDIYACGIVLKTILKFSYSKWVPIVS